MHLLFTKNILADHSVIVSANIKNDPIASLPQQIGRAECAPDVTRLLPVSIPDFLKPVSERRLTAGMFFDKIINGLPFYEVNLHQANVKITIKFSKRELSLKITNPRLSTLSKGGEVGALEQSGFPDK